MEFRDLILRNRSYRRFYQESSIDMMTLEQLVDLARLSATAKNQQPLKYFLTCTPEKNELVFSHISWAVYLKDWAGPAQGEKPSAYIIILGDRNIRQTFGCDHGIAAQSILLGAVEKGLGGCMIGSIQREQLRQVLSIPAQFEILLVVALGKPKEKIAIEAVGADGKIEYWRSDDGTHHVPKRSLKEIIIRASL